MIFSSSGTNICMCMYTYVVCTYVPPITIHRRIGEQTDVQKWWELMQNSDWEMKRGKERKCTRNGEEMRRRKGTK